jgi:KDO2-lipid IV(A) lauroyltransferase
MWQYRIGLAFGRLISLIPFGALYGISNTLAWFLEHVLHYRQAVIYGNLVKSFPEKSAAELKKIQRAFYRNFSDTLMETFKSLRISKAEMQKRYRLRNPEVLQQLKEKNKGLILVMGHNTNFEWVAMGLPLVVPQECFAVYHPLKNKLYNQKVVEIREQFGLKLFRMKETYPFMLNNATPAPLYLFMADQSPHKGKIKYRTPFLNQSTAVHLGVENLAKACNLAVVFINIYRVKRGYYEIEPKLLFEDVQETPRYTITKAHVAALEDLIKRDPANWLWSHKRWKYAEA